MIEIKVDNKNVIAALERLARATADMRPALLAIGEDLVKSTKKRFETSTAPDGSHWAANSAVTLKRKKGGKPLIGKTRLLAQQIYSNVDGNGLQVGSIMEYAAMQQFGGKKSKFPHLWGDIPARPFLGISDADEQKIVSVVNDYLRRVVG